MDPGMRIDPLEGESNSGGLQDFMARRTAAGAQRPMPILTTGGNNGETVPMNAPEPGVQPIPPMSAATPGALQGGGVAGIINRLRGVHPPAPPSGGIGATPGMIQKRMAPGSMLNPTPGMVKPQVAPKLSPAGGGMLPDMAFEDPNNVNGLYGRSAGTSVAYNAAARQRHGLIATPNLIRPRMAPPPSFTPTPGLVRPQSGASPGGVSSIDPTSDLRSKQITSEEPTDIVGRSRQLSDLTAGEYGNTDVDAGASVDPISSARLGRYGDLTDQSIGNLAGVDRVKLAQDALDRFDQQQLPEHELALRKLTEKYAARGGARSGQLRTAYGDEDLARQRDRDLMKKQLIDEATQGSIEDQFRKTGVLQGAEEGLSSREAAMRGEQRGERTFKAGVQEGNVNRRLSTRQAAQSRGTQLAGAEQESARSRAGDLRGERDYENAMENQGFNRRILQHQLETSDKGAEFEHAMQLLGAGEAGNPSQILEQLSQSGLDPAAIAQIASTLGGKRAATGTAAPAPAGGGTPSPGINWEDLLQERL